MKYREFIGMMRKRAFEDISLAPKHAQTQRVNSYLSNQLAKASEDIDTMVGSDAAIASVPENWEGTSRLPLIRGFQANNYVNSVYNKLFPKGNFGKEFNESGHDDAAKYLPTGMSFRDYLKRLFTTAGERNARNTGVEGQFWSPEKQEEYDKLRQYPIYKKLQEDLNIKQYEDSMAHNKRGGNNRVIG